MVWGRTSDCDDRRDRSKSLTAAYHGPAGLPAPREGQIPGHWTSAPSGSRGGAPIWVEHAPEDFGPEDDVTIRFKGSACNKCGTSRHLSSAHDASADPDGFAVFGRFPNRYLQHILRARRLGDVRRNEILHVCSGTLGPDEAWTVDVRPEARPRVVADGKALPFRNGSFRAVLLDPPYSDQYARNLYGTENPRPSWLLREAARVLASGGRVGILHVAVPFSPPSCHLVRSWPVTTGVGFRVRTLTVYEKEQERLL